MKTIRNTSRRQLSAVDGPKTYTVKRGEVASLPDQVADKFLRRGGCELVQPENTTTVKKEKSNGSGQKPAEQKKEDAVDNGLGDDLTSV